MSFKFMKANRRADGVVVYLGHYNTWVVDPDDAVAIASPEAEVAAGVLAEAAVLERRIIGARLTPFAGEDRRDARAVLGGIDA